MAIRVTPPRPRPPQFVSGNGRNDKICFSYYGGATLTRRESLKKDFSGPEPSRVYKWPSCVAKSDSSGITRPAAFEIRALQFFGLIIGLPRVGEKFGL